MKIHSWEVSLQMENRGCEYYPLIFFSRLISIMPHQNFQFSSSFSNNKQPGVIIRHSKSIFFMESIDDTLVHHMDQVRTQLWEGRGQNWVESTLKHSISFFLFAIFTGSNWIPKSVNEIEECHRVQRTKIWHTRVIPK